MLQAIDAAMIEFESSRPRTVRAIVIHMLEESPAAIPELDDLFYSDRIGELVAGSSLVWVEEGKDVMSHVVAVATGDGCSRSVLRNNEEEELRFDRFPGSPIE